MRHALRLFPVPLIATAAAYFPAWRGGLLWDDDAHLTAEALRSAAGLPLLHSAFWLFYQLLGYHLVNIALHAASAALFFVILSLERIRVYRKGRRE